MTVSDLVGGITLLAILGMAVLGVALGIENNSKITACEEKLILRSDRCELVAVPVTAHPPPAGRSRE